MRDTVKYPVTTDEIVRLLNQYLERERGGLGNPDRAIGNMTILILEEAVRRIQEGTTPRVLYHGTVDGLIRRKPK